MDLHVVQAHPELIPRYAGVKENSIRLRIEENIT